MAGYIAWKQTDSARIFDESSPRPPNPPAPITTHGKTAANRAHQSFCVAISCVHVCRWCSTSWPRSQHSSTSRKAWTTSTLHHRVSRTTCGGAVRDTSPLARRKIEANASARLGVIRLPVRRQPLAATLPHLGGEEAWRERLTCWGDNRSSPREEGTPRLLQRSGGFCSNWSFSAKPLRASPPHLLAASATSSSSLPRRRKLGSVLFSRRVPTIAQPW